MGAHSLIHSPLRRCETLTAHIRDHASRAHQPGICGLPGWKPREASASELNSTLGASHCASVHRGQRFPSSWPPGRRFVLHRTSGPLLRCAAPSPGPVRPLERGLPPLLRASSPPSRALAQPPPSPQPWPPSGVHIHPSDPPFSRSCLVPALCCVPSDRSRVARRATDVAARVAGRAAGAAGSMTAAWVAADAAAWPPGWPVAVACAPVRASPAALCSSSRAAAGAAAGAAAEAAAGSKRRL